MTITDDQLVAVRIRGVSVPIGTEQQFGGGEVPKEILDEDSLAVANVRPECVTPKIFWAG